MGLSRIEVNLRRLLAKCEIKIKTKEKDDHRFPKYVESLEDMLSELSRISEKPGEETIAEYRKRIKSLKFHLGMTTTDIADQPTDGSHKTGLESSLLKENGLTQREELLGIRQRNMEKRAGNENLDELIDYHQDMHERIADDMLKLARNLKEQSELASQIIKKDTEVVGRSSQLTEQNFSKLKIESGKLDEHSKRAWKCWMWIMLLVVMVVFVNMVMFMKVVKKK